MKKRIVLILLSLSMIVSSMSATSATTYVEPAAFYKQYEKYFDSTNDALKKINDKNDAALDEYVGFLKFQDDNFDESLGAISVASISDIKNNKFTKLYEKFKQEGIKTTISFSNDRLDIKYASTASASTKVKGSIYYYIKTGRMAMSHTEDGETTIIDVFRTSSAIYSQILFEVYDGRYMPVMIMLKNGATSVGRGRPINIDDPSPLRITKTPKSFDDLSAGDFMTMIYQKGAAKVTIFEMEETYK